MSTSTIDDPSAETTSVVPGAPGLCGIELTVDDGTDTDTEELGLD